MSNINLPSLEELMKNGVHFGHQTAKRYPKASSYIYAEKNGIHIIDLEKTIQGLEQALEFIEKIVKAGGVILFIGSKKQAKVIVKAAADKCGMPYIIGRWLGGTFTNFENIVKLTKKLEKLEKDQADGAWEVYTKKEQVTFKKEMAKLNDTVGGIKTMKRLPQAIFVVDIKKEKTSVSEANKIGLPVIAMVDTNVNPEQVNYPIPANDDAIKSIDLMVNLIADCINAAKQATVKS
ncbi:MAG: 30S ribosomal protein S2 [Parcubacteria group bacterium]|nr:MAG: 30S ribosomal protein S2 [Parcubacteria group bacterium]